MQAGSEPIVYEDTKKPEGFLRVARERFDISQTYWRRNFQEAMDDLRFMYIDQWGVADRTARAGRPCLTLNKLPTYLDQVLGDQRQNRPTIKVHPVEADRPSVKPVQQGQTQEQQVTPEATSKVKNVAGTNDYTEAEIRGGLIRNIEQISTADAHYDTAFQQGVESGMGWLRVITAYSSVDTFDQDLLIKSVPDRFSVLIDPRATSEPDFSSADYCFISDLMPRKEFRKRYPDAIDSSFDVNLLAPHIEWYTEDSVRVSEYFWREPVTRTLILLSDGRTMWKDKVEPVLDELAQEGIVPVKDRKVKTFKVMWAKITALSILEKAQEVPFDTIPVVPVLGKSVTIKGNTYYRGLIRYAKDAQRMHNYMMSSAVERVGLAPKAPYIADAKSIEGYEGMWEAANWKNASVLKYNHRMDVPPPRREQPPTMPAAELNLAMTAVDEIKSTIGMFNASLGERGTATSGVQEKDQQRQGDRGTFSFVDNLSRSLQRIGKLLVYAIPEVYDAERVIRIKFVNGKGDWVKINESVIDHQTGNIVQIHDIAAGKFDVTVTTGPSYQTQRIESAESMMNFMKFLPEVAPRVADIAVAALDFPDSEAFVDRIKRGLPPGTLTPQESQEAGIPPPQPPQPTPADQAMMAKANADIEMAKAKSLEAQVKIKELEMAAQMANPATMADAVRNLIAEALAEIAAKPQQQGQAPVQGQTA